MAGSLLSSRSHRLGVFLIQDLWAKPVGSFPSLVPVRGKPQVQRLSSALQSSLDLFSPISTPEKKCYYFISLLLTSIQAEILKPLSLLLR